MEWAGKGASRREKCESAFSRFFKLILLPAAYPRREKVYGKYPKKGHTKSAGATSVLLLFSFVSLLENAVRCANYRQVEILEVMMCARKED